MRDLQVRERPIMSRRAITQVLFRIIAVSKGLYPRSFRFLIQTDEYVDLMPSALYLLWRQLCQHFKTLFL